MPAVKNVTPEFKLVNIHQVNGDINAIQFLMDADFHLVEGLFLRAKLRGHAEFKYHGRRYRIEKNKDLTYTVREMVERPSLLDSF